MDLPGGSGGIGLDDIEYSPELHRVLVPGGRTGELFLVNPDDDQITAVPGFSYTKYWDRRKEDGPTGLGYGRGLIMVTDRTTAVLSVVDPVQGQIVGSVPETADGDCVRFVPPTNEIWVSEPDQNQVEIFSLPTSPPFDPVRLMILPLHDPLARGPEELVVDVTRSRVYMTHFTPPGPGGSAIVLSVDMNTHAIVEQWPETCLTGHGMRMDEERGLLFGACAEGKVVTMDVTHNGHIVSSVSTTGANYDIMGYAPKLSHIYLSGDGCSCLNILGISEKGALSVLGTFDSPTGSQSVTADDRGHVWMADPYGGRLVKMDDPFPASR